MADSIEIKSLNLQIQESTTIFDLTKMSVNIFNENFSKDNLPFRLKNNYADYCLKQSKKSGKPDMDLPSFDRNTLVLNSSVKNYTLVCKDDPQSRACFVNVLKNEMKPSLCRNCSIL